VRRPPIPIDQLGIALALISGSNAATTSNALFRSRSAVIKLMTLQQLIDGLRRMDPS